MTKKANAVTHPPHPVYQHLVGQKYLSIEDRDRMGRTRFVTVQFVRDECRIHDRKKRPYAHTIGIITAASDYAGARLIGREKTCVISVARLLKTNLFALVDAKGNPPAPKADYTREQVESHQVSDGRGGEFAPCDGKHPGDCHEQRPKPAHDAPVPPSSRDELRGASERAPLEPGDDHPSLPAEECPA